MVARNQHYVPQFHLRRFSPDGPAGRRVGMARVPSLELIPAVSIKDQCSKDWLYGKGKVEDLLGKLEADIAELFRRIVHAQVPPKPGSGDHAQLVQALLLQKARTLAAADLTTAITRHMGEMTLPAICTHLGEADLADQVELVPTDPVQDSLSQTLDLWPLLLDLEAILLTNRTPEGFILSDDPVVFYNTYLQAKGKGIGAQSVGLQIYLPLDPDHALLLVDPATYFNRRRNPSLVLNRQADIQGLNALAVLNVRQALYFHPQRTSGRHLEVVWKRVAPFYGVPRTSLQRFVKDETRAGAFVAMEPTSGTPPREELVMIDRRTPNLCLDLSFLEIQPARLRERRVFESRPIPRDPALAQAHKDFHELVRKGKWKQHEFLAYLDDLQFRRRLQNSRFGSF